VFGPASARGARKRVATRDSDATQARILQAAKTLFSRNSYEGVGVREIASNADVDSALVIRYFGSKEGLFRTLIALARRAREGGSYRVQVSLCQSAMLLQRQGLLDDFSNAPGSLIAEEFEALSICDDNTVYGDLETLGPVLRMSETSCAWLGTTPELGSSKPGWLPH
jgi:AcrR family transcriptional regulator